MKKRVALINPYFGKFPVWFDAFLISCAENPSVSFFIPTDCTIPERYPDNVRFIPMSLTDLRKRAESRVGIQINLNRAYKVNDIRPAFGLIFADLLVDFEFWGHCDLDLIWGDISAFVTDSILDNYDVISARKEKICGHFTLYRNCDYVNTLFRKSKFFRPAFTNDESYYFDEVGMTDVVSQEIFDETLSVYWPNFLLNFVNPPPERGVSNLPRLLNNWVWRNGKVFDLSNNGGEVMYLHFMTWKRSMKYCFVDYDSSCGGEMYISYTHISTQRIPIPLVILGFKVPWLRNLF